MPSGPMIALPPRITNASSDAARTGSRSSPAGSADARISEPAADLAVMLAIQSSLRGRSLPRGFIAFGEVGLAGEIRPAPRGQERLKEAAKLGFSVALVPKANAPKKPIEGLVLHPVERIEQAIEIARSL